MRSKSHHLHTPLLSAALSATLTLLLSVPGAPAQSTGGGAPDYGTPQEQAEEFIASFSKAAAGDAIADMLQRNPFFDDATITKGTAGVRQITGIVRLFLDHELIAAEQITERYEALTYVLHFERQPILLQLRFYNVAKNTWLAHSWHFSADPEALISAVRIARETAGPPEE